MENSEDNFQDNNFQFSQTEGQQRIDNWFKNLPAEVTKIEQELNSLIQQFNSLQLIANISHNNHLRNVNEAYSDYNEGRMAVKPETLSLLLLRKPFRENCAIDKNQFKEKVDEVDDLLGKFIMTSDAIKTMGVLPKKFGSETTLEKVTNKLNRDETFVRNPGFPDHHYEFVEELYNSLENEIERQFGFSIKNSVTIRKALANLINLKFRSASREANEKADQLRNEVIRFRNTGLIKQESLLSKSQFYELKEYSSKRLKVIFRYHFQMEIYYELQKIHGLTVDEIADYCKLNIPIVKKFMDRFSCEFDTVITDDELIGANTLLKTKPIIRHEQMYMIPSYAMFTWCVEPEIEAFIKTSNKLSNLYKDIKHDFLLRKGLEFFKKILPDAIFYPENLYYGYEANICETDALIAYDDVLFIVEAKGHRMTNKAKSGNYQRTENHLKEIIGDAVIQAKRTIEFIKSSSSVTFKTKNNDVVNINSAHFTEFITINLTLEPIGNLTPLMKVVNDLNYFNEDNFPWIVSIYDLVVFADFIELPILFIQYLKRRKRFLEIPNTYIFEEIDLLGYFLSNGLYIESTIEEGEEKQMDLLSFDNNTDDFNDYYIWKYGHKEKLVHKRKSFISDDLKTILQNLMSSTVKNKTHIMLELLDIDSSSIKKLTEHIKKIKRQYCEDGELHDCSLCTEKLFGNFGITYIIGSNVTDVQKLLNKYCEMKFTEHRAKLWLGIGDIDSDLDNYQFQCSFLKKT